MSTPRLARPYEILISRNRNDVDGVLAGIVLQSGILENVPVLIENLGLVNITVHAYVSADNGATDAWSEIALNDNADDNLGMTVVPRGIWQGWLLNSALKAYIKFEATPARQALGRILLTRYDGSFDLVERAANAPVAPSSLTATAISTTEIDLAWTDNANDERYTHVERSADGSTGWSEIGVVPSGTTTFKDTTLSEATKYYYRVRAEGQGGGAQFSAYSTTANATTVLPAPTLLTATAGSGKIDLAWTDNASTETGFSIERSADGVTSWAEVNTPAANATTYSDTITTGQTRYYRIRAKKTAINSAYSNIAHATAA